MNCEMALTTSARMGSPWSAAKLPTVSYERRTAKFLSWRASFRNIPEFMSARRSKRYNSSDEEGARKTGRSRDKGSRQGQRARGQDPGRGINQVLVLSCG